MPALADFAPNFESGDIRFLTFRGTEAVHQKTDWVRGHCAKVSDTFIVVREANKKTEGYHFHALLKVKKEPTNSWFKKGCHFHLAKVGVPTIQPGALIMIHQDTPARDLADWELHGPDEAKEVEEVREDEMLERVMKKAKKNLRLATGVLRVLRYMSKDFEFPIQYHDYVISLDKKVKEYKL